MKELTSVAIIFFYYFYIIFTLFDGWKKEKPWKRKKKPCIWKILT